MDLQLEGLHAVVTGGSSGIGAATVRMLASEGCRVSFCARGKVRVDEMLAASAQLPGKVEGHVLDATNSHAMAAWFVSLATFDIFIANASAVNPTDWKVCVESDILPTVAVAEAAIPYLMKSSHAALTYIGSRAAGLGAPRSAAYAASKAALIHYMKSLSMQVMPTIRVNTVSPGDTLVPGGLWDGVRQSDPELFKSVVLRNPLGRLATADEIARVVAFVSSPAASFVAGANWQVDGGSATHVRY